MLLLNIQVKGEHMMQFLRIKYLPILCLLFFNITYATDYYVDNNAAGSNNGTSWQNAWESFSDINWSSVQPGDIIYISGGSSGKTYSETLNIGTSGTVGNNVVITKGIDSGHNGEVIIDGGNSITNGIKFGSTDDYVTVREFTIRNTTGYCIKMEGGWTGSSGNYGWSNPIIGSRVEYCKMHITNSPGVLAKATWRLYFYKNVITTSTNTSAQTDGYFSQASSHNTWDGDSIIISNQNSSPHCDGIQINQDTSDIVKNCYIEQDNSKSSNAQGIYIEDTWGTFIIYNNIVNQTQSSSNAITYSHPGGIGADGDVQIYSNTVYGEAGASHSIWIRYQIVDPIVENNIISYVGTQGPGIVQREGRYGSVDNNRQHNVYNPTGSNITTDDPLFTNPSIGDFTLQGTSTVINTGNTLGSPYDIDIVGTSRPQGNGWDIGAYEFTTRGGDITPPEVTGATLLDSVTLKVMFSEVLDESTAEDENNYSISNNIDIFNATLSGSEVTLQTSVHSPGWYTVAVNNVTDLAGNIINANNNSADYEMSEDPLGELYKLNIIEATASVVPEANHTPDKTIDGMGYFNGDPDSRWAGDTMPEWIQFDLGSEHLIFLSKLSFYKWNDGRTYNYSILFSSDNNNWTEILSNVQSAEEEWTLNEFEGISARYLRVLFNYSAQTSWASLWECEIWGLVPTNVNSLFPPSEFELYQNYPNPFNPSTTIEFTIPTSGEVLIEVFNALGEKIEILANQKYDAGTHSVVFNKLNIPAGIYFYRILTQSFQQTKKMILLK